MSTLDDLIERLERASEELGRLCDRYKDPEDSATLERARLYGKRQGVELVLSYAREAKRDDDNAAKAEAAFQEYANEADQ